jgi:hypothetical protein
MYMESVRQRRYLINVALSAVAVGVIVFYSICGNSCSYLKGSIMGVELQYVGIAYMAALIFLNLLRKDFFILVFLSAGLGVEAFLVGFQIVYAKYCPYCLIFGSIVLAQFVLNFDRKRRWSVVSSMIIAIMLFAVLFKGTAYPTYVLKTATNNSDLSRSHCPDEPITLDPRFTRTTFMTRQAFFYSKAKCSFLTSLRHASTASAS